jgi:hypothetical protein
MDYGQGQGRVFKNDVRAPAGTSSVNNQLWQTMMWASSRQGGVYGMVDLRGRAHAAGHIQSRMCGYWGEDRSQGVCLGM